MKELLAQTRHKELTLRNLVSVNLNSGFTQGGKEGYGNFNSWLQHFLSSSLMDFIIEAHVKLIMSVMRHTVSKLFVWINPWEGWGMPWVSGWCSLGGQFWVNGILKEREAQIGRIVCLWACRTPLHQIWSTFPWQSLSSSQLEDDCCQHKEECVPAQGNHKTSPNHHTGQTPTWMWN